MIMTYRYSSLTAALGDPRSPLRQLFDELFPNTRDVQAAYRQGQPHLLVEGGTANPGTLGSAFDYAMRFALDPNYDAALARAAFTDHIDVVSNIVAVNVAAQVAQLLGDRETVFRASWALGLLTEVYRIGPMPGSPLQQLIQSDGMQAQPLLELAPEDAIAQLTAMDQVAQTALIPHLQGPYVLGPTFDGSALCAADADVIANGLLLDLKTRLGGKVKRSGGRSDYLLIQDLRQIIGYTLFDHSDEHTIRRVGIYSARFGHLVVWDLGEVLEMLAGHPIDLADAREQVWLALGGRSSSARSRADR